MKKVIILGSLTALIFSACKKDDNSNSNTVSASDKTFVMQASMSNTAEVQAGNLASSKASSAAVKAFAQYMVTEHTTAQTDLQKVASTYNLTLADSVDASHVALLSQLNALSGRAFDSVYIHSQITDHQNALNLFNNEISSGTNASVKNYASTYKPHIQMHLNMADSISHSF